MNERMNECISNEGSTIWLWVKSLMQVFHVNKDTIHIKNDDVESNIFS